MDEQVQKALDATQAWLDACVAMREAGKARDAAYDALSNAQKIEFSRARIITQREKEAG